MAPERIRETHLGRAVDHHIRPTYQARRRTRFREVAKHQFNSVALRLGLRAVPPDQGSNARR